jgi:hypothetical protein
MEIKVMSRSIRKKLKITISMILMIARARN